MATGSPYIRLIFAGGWATDFGPHTHTNADQGGRIALPFLVDAENVLFTLDGGPRKIPGTAKLNSSVMESGAVIKGLFDYWDTGTIGSPAQHRIVHVGTVIKKDDADGTFINLFTGLTADAVPDYTVLEDVLVLSSDGDVPKSWDGTTAQNLAGTPPNFAFAETHKNRMWAAGVDANSSRLYYSVLLDPEDWIGTGSGTIDIDPRDGDSITGLISHKNELWVFKGPHKGSIHRITGSSPTGDDAFARTTFVQGVGAVGNNTIFRFANDIGFMWSDGSVRSLAATEAFGDYLEASISRGINIEFLNARANIDRLKHAWAATDDTLGIIAITLPIDSSTNNNVMVAFDYRFQPARPSLINTLSAGCVASVIDATNNSRRILMLGGNDGFVRRWNQVARTNDGTGIPAKITTPYIDYGSAAVLKTLMTASLGLQATTDDTVTFGWTRDENAQQTQTVTQGGTGVALDTFLLDTDLLGGGKFVDRFLELEEGGEFRSIQYQILHSTNGVDLDLHSLDTQVSPGSLSTEN